MVLLYKLLTIFENKTFFFFHEKTNPNPNPNPHPKKGYIFFLHLNLNFCKFTKITFYKHKFTICL